MKNAKKIAYRKGSKFCKKFKRGKCIKTKKLYKKVCLKYYHHKKDVYKAPKPKDVYKGEPPVQPVKPAL